MSDGSGQLVLHQERTFDAPPNRVFAAFVDREQLAEWWGPFGFTAPELELDARAGGRYRITMQPPEGEAFHLRGAFREVGPARLVYTFEWEEPDPDDRETIVTVSFLDEGSRTRVVLDQGPFATEARLVLHDDGWRETLERLAKFLR